MNSGVITSLICILAFVAMMMFIFMSASIRIVQEEKRLHVYRLGRDIGLKGPGVVLLIPFVERGILVDAGSQIPSAQALVENQTMIGEARTLVFQDGEVLLGGKVWPAISSRPIQAGQRVRLKRVLLEVDEV